MVVQASCYANQKAVNLISSMLRLLLVRLKRSQIIITMTNFHRLSRLTCAALIIGSAPYAYAAPKYFPDPDRYATRRVAAYLASKDCPGAVNALNEGVKARQRDVLLLAGSMFETGLCVKENWEKAAHYYQLADAAGNRAAVPRLAAGYAVAGRDNAVALWWNAHHPVPAPDECVPKANPETDIEAFEAALKSMPPAVFKACVYMIGVVSAIRAETEFPVTAAQHDVFGDVTMEFNPAAGKISWRQAAEQGLAGIKDVNKHEYDDRRAIENSLVTYMETTGKRVLSRFQRPDGIPADTRIRHRFSFSYK